MNFQTPFQNNNQQQKGAQGSQFPDQTQVRDRAKGCILGAFIGDSMGSRLEFQNNITQYDVQEALQLRGGGIFKLLPGQLTDDGELVIAQARGLLKGESTKINTYIANIVKEYHHWISSQPFDFGATMQNSWNPLLFKDENDVFKNKSDDQIIALIQDNAKSVSSESQSNGFLMKQSPLGVFLWNKPQDVIFSFAQQDTLLTHNHSFCLDVSRIYVYTLSQLVKRGNDEHFEIYCECRKIIWEDESFTGQIKDVLSEVEALFGGIQDKDLLKKKKSKPYKLEKKLPGSSKDNIGWVKWAFIYSMVALLQDDVQTYSLFEKILQLEGDTDTNLCIVGAVIGARKGTKEFQNYFQIVQICNPSQNQNQRRGVEWSPGQYENLAESLINKSEKQKQIDMSVSNSSMLKSLEILQQENQKDLKNVSFFNKQIEKLEGCFIDTLQKCKIERMINCFFKKIDDCQIGEMINCRAKEIKYTNIKQISFSLFESNQSRLEYDKVKIGKNIDSYFAINVD